MRSDPDLRTTLRRAAARVEVEGPPVGRIAARGRRRSRLRALGASLSVVALLVAAGAVGTLVRDAEAPGEVRALPADEAGRDRRTGASGAELQAEEGGPSPLTAGSGVSDLSNDAVGAPGGDDAGRETEEAEAPLATGPRIVKRAEVRLEVEPQAFQEVFGRAQRLAAAHGGFVAESSTRGQDGRGGELVIRVPSARFEETLADLKGLGKVMAEEVSGEDVTADFVDLRARLRNWRSQERAIRALMARASSIDQSIRIQKELHRVRLEIEKILGSLRVLRDRTALGTIAVAMREAGTEAEREEAPGILARAWDRALHGSLEVVAAVTVGLGYLLPVLVLLALAWLAFRAVRPRPES